MTGIWVLLGLLAILVVWGIILFNGLVSRRQMVNNGWADIDVQLKRRADLIPQLVTTVRGYAEHERELFADITEKRMAAVAAGDDLGARGRAETELSRPVGRLMAVAEDYPDLKASDNFQDLQQELSDTETKIEMARRFYNGAVRELNTAIETVPSNVVAGTFGFSKRDYFEIELADRALPDVNFGDDS